MLPYPQVLSGRGKDVLPCPLDIRDPHHFGRWELMLELIDFLEAILAIFIEPKVNDIHLIIHRVSVIAGHCHLELVILPVPEGNRVILKVAIICIGFLSLPKLRETVNIVLSFPAHVFAGLSLWPYQVIWLARPLVH